MSYLGIEGLHALVTGASGGIGRAIVEELLGTNRTKMLQMKTHTKPMQHQRLDAK